MSIQPTPRTVFFDHDGGIDDLLSLIMLLSMPHIKLAGVMVTPADCFLRPAVSATLKILRFFNRLDVEVAEGTLPGVNPFPREWRTHPYAVNALPILNQLDPKAAASAIKSTKPRSKTPFSVEPLKDLMERLRDNLILALDEDSDPEKRRTLQALFVKELRRENVILSEMEGRKIFRSLMIEVLRVGRGYLPATMAQPAHEYLAEKLHQAEEPVTMLITGPVTNLSMVLYKEPVLAEKIEDVFWMGGALQVPGNVTDYEHDGSAEWNVYWDPVAAYKLWKTEIPITLFPLDVTNKVPVDMDFVHRLAQQRNYPVSDLAGQCWALTTGMIPAYEYMYYMWDTLTTGALGSGAFLTYRQAQTQVLPYGPSAGQIKEVREDGKRIRVADTVDATGFQNYVLELLRR